MTGSFHQHHARPRVGRQGPQKTQLFADGRCDQVQGTTAEQYGHIAGNGHVLWPEQAAETVETHDTRQRGRGDNRRQRHILDLALQKAGEIAEWQIIQRPLAAKAKAWLRLRSTRK